MNCMRNAEKIFEKVSSVMWFNVPAKCSLHCANYLALRAFTNFINMHSSQAMEKHCLWKIKSFSQIITVPSALDALEEET